MWVEDVYEDGMEFQRIILPEYNNIIDVGKPSLPGIGDFIGYFSPSKIEIELKEINEITIGDFNLYPSQEPKPEINSSYYRFDYNTDFYNQSIWYPDENSNVSETMIFRDLFISHFGVCPFKYNPLKKELRIYHKFVVILDYTEGEPNFDFTYKGYVDKEYADMYESLILNYEELNPPELDRDGGYNYLIITHPDYINQSEDLKNYLEDKFLSLSISIHQMNTNNWHDVYDYIDTFYDDNQNDYVLLMGDVEDIPIPYRSWTHPESGTEEDIPSDMVYACLDGDDVIPEVAVGRLSVNSPNDAQEQINKIKDHYNSLYIDRFDGILVAHKQQEQQGGQGHYYPFIWCKYDIFIRYDPRPNLDITYLWGTDEFASTDYLIQCLNNMHYLIVNYRGHGTDDHEPDHSGGCWSDWCGGSPPNSCFEQSKIQDVDPEDERPVVFSICCLTGNITRETCFCEEWMRVDGGAVGIIGATVITYTPGNTPFDKNLFNVLYDFHEGRLGKTQNWAKLEMLKKLYGTTDWKYGINTHLAFLLLGDPSLNILIPTQIPPNLTYNSSKQKDEELTKTTLNEKKPECKIYSNPIIDDKLVLSITSNEAGNGEISIYDISGRKVFNRKFDINCGESVINYDLNSMIKTSGVYILHINTPEIDETKNVIFLNN